MAFQNASRVFRSAPITTVGLSAKTGHLLYGVGGAGYYGRQGDRNPSLRIYALKDRKETTLVEDIRGYVLSDDGSKVLVAQGPGVQPLRRHAAWRKIAQGSCDFGFVRRSSAGRRVEPDLQRSLATLSRLVLRFEHARLRLGCVARAIQAAA